MKGEAKREESLTKTRRRRNFRGKGGVEKFAPRKLLGRRLNLLVLGCRLNLLVLGRRAMALEQFAWSPHHCNQLLGCRPNLLVLAYSLITGEKQFLSFSLDI